MLTLAQARLLLHLTSAAQRNNIKRAYRLGALKAHPDKGGSAQEFRRLKEAHNTLLLALNGNAPRKRKRSPHPDSHSPSNRSRHPYAYAPRNRSPQPYGQQNSAGALHKRYNRLCHDAHKVFQRVYDDKSRGYLSVVDTHTLRIFMVDLSPFTFSFAESGQGQAIVISHYNKRGKWATKWLSDTGFTTQNFFKHVKLYQYISGGNQQLDALMNMHFPEVPRIEMKLKGTSNDRTVYTQGKVSHINKLFGRIPHGEEQYCCEGWDRIK